MNKAYSYNQSSNEAGKGYQTILSHSPNKTSKL